MNPEDTLAKMSAMDTLSSLSENEGIQRLAELVDVAADCASHPGLEHALELAETLRPNCSLASLAHLDYCVGNAWSALRHLRIREGADQWPWEQAEFEQEVISLRRALLHSEEPGVPAGRRVQILTNLGNLMSTLGRTVEAIAYYDRVLIQFPRFGMALGNRGQAFATYSEYDYDQGHRTMLLAQARDDFSKAIQDQNEPKAHAAFLARLEHIDELGLRESLHDFDLTSFSLGSEPEETRFRQWVLNERMFLNTLNDLGAYPVASNDFLHLPTIITSLRDRTIYHSCFNQLKQEFATARWLAYEAIQCSPVDAIANRGLRLLDARDGATYGLRLEKLRLSFRTAYALLDKIAVYLNAYWELGLPAHKVTFRSVWFEKKKGQARQLNPKIPLNNLPLRGLYWLAKDFSEKGDEFINAIEPDARDVASIRNHLEHKFLRITPVSESDWDFVTNISEDFLEKRTLRLLRSGRAALIYLVLAIHTHENIHFNSKTDKPVVSDQLGEIPE